MADSLAQIVERSHACLKLTFRPTYNPHPSKLRPGYGDCASCTYDPVNNPHCAGYVPGPSIISFYVKNREDR